VNVWSFDWLIQSSLSLCNTGITELQSHRMVGVRRDSGDHLVQPPCRSRVTYSRLHRTVSRWVLSISREGDSTTSLGSLFQCSVTLRGKKFFLMFTRNFLFVPVAPCPATGHHWKESGPILLTPIPKIFISI